MKNLTILALFRLKFWLSVSLIIATVRPTSAVGLVKSAAMYSFDPTKVDGLIENSEQQVKISCNSSSLEQYDSVTIKLTSADLDIASVAGEKVVFCQCDSPVSVSNTSQFVVRGLFLGRTIINVETLNATRLIEGVNRRPTKVLNASFPVVRYHVSVIRQERLIDHLFLVLATAMLVCANIGMGCKIDMKIVREVLRKPIAPGIGFSCQYVIMPLVSMITTFFGVFIV